MEEVIAARPGKEILQVTSDILGFFSGRRKTCSVFRSGNGSGRSLQANRNWQFDEEVLAGRSRKEETTYKIEKEKEQWVVLFLPQEFTTVQETRFKARLKFIHAAEMAEGKVMK